MSRPAQYYYKRNIISQSNAHKSYVNCLIQFNNEIISCSTDSLIKIWQ